MKRFILDTSLFTNPDVFLQFGTDAQKAILSFARIACRVDAEFFMPGSVYDELSKMKDLREIAADFESVVGLRSPRKHDLNIPSELLYELIEEVLKIMRQRSIDDPARPRYASRFLNQQIGR